MTTAKITLRPFVKETSRKPETAKQTTMSKCATDTMHSTALKNTHIQLTVLILTTKILISIQSRTIVQEKHIHTASYC